MAAGVMITASAKLNSSTLGLRLPRSRPVEIVAPERENPRNGRHKPWTAPIHAASRIPIARLRNPSAFGQSGDEDQYPRRRECGGDEAEVAEQ